VYFLVLESAARAAFEVPFLTGFPTGRLGWSQIWKEAKGVWEFLAAAETKSCGVAEFLGGKHGIQV